MSEMRRIRLLNSTGVLEICLAVIAAGNRDAVAAFALWATGSASLYRSRDLATIRERRQEWRRDGFQA